MRREEASGDGSVEVEPREGSAESAGGEIAAVVGGIRQSGRMET